MAEMPTMKVEVNIKGPKPKRHRWEDPGIVNCFRKVFGVTLKLRCKNCGLLTKSRKNNDPCRGKRK